MSLWIWWAVSFTNNDIIEKDAVETPKIVSEWWQEIFDKEYVASSVEQSMQKLLPELSKKDFVVFSKLFSEWKPNIPLEQVKKELAEGLLEEGVAKKIWEHEVIKKKEEVVKKPSVVRLERGGLFESTFEFKSEDKGRKEKTMLTDVQVQHIIDLMKKIDLTSDELTDMETFVNNGRENIIQLYGPILDEIADMYSSSNLVVPTTPVEFKNALQNMTWNVISPTDVHLVYQKDKGKLFCEMRYDILDDGNVEKQIYLRSNWEYVFS